MKLMKAAEPPKLQETNLVWCSYGFQLSGIFSKTFFFYCIGPIKQKKHVTQDTFIKKNKSSDFV